MLRNGGTPAFAVRIVSYNVLSSHLASPSHFTTLDPTHLDASNRLPKIFQKLQEELGGESDNGNRDNRKVVFCLQEVSRDWVGKFHTWFANRGYHLVTGNYGRTFNGYMGVALAYPTSAFETLDVDVSQLSDKRVDGWPVEPETGLSTKVWYKLKSLWKSSWKAVGFYQDEPIDHWDMSEKRRNILLTATLKDRDTGRSFCVANYHMPCAFFAPMVITIHAEMAARHIQILALGGDTPYILAGDYNILPDSATYRMLTTGKLPPTDPSFPTPKHGMEFRCCEIKPLRSAYAESDHGEPDFTNYARIGGDDPFIGTIDYIFLSPEWKVVKVKPVVHREVANGPFPNQVEPSDHIVIAADLEL